MEVADNKYNSIKSRIIIERGASLILQNGAKITSAEGCEDSMWEGIYVWGDPNQPHSNTSAHGTVEVYDSEISNARTAINTFRLNNINHTVNWDYTGGIVKAKFATFKNNKRDVQIQRFPFENISFFEGCHFLTDGGPNDGDTLLPHVTIWNTNGVEFIGNTFENTQLVTQTNERTGTGIYIGKGDVIIESGDVTSPGGATQANKPNLFKNLFIGVEYSLVGGANTVTLNGNVFENNIYGITLDGVQYVEATNNTFKVPALAIGPYIPGATPPPTNYQTFGVYGNSVEAFSIEQNNFVAGTGNHNGTGAASYGVFIKNSNGFAQGGEVYHNTFTGLKKSNQFEADNSNLQIDCNTYTSVYRDWVVASGNLAIQGQCLALNDEAPHANIFSPAGSVNRQIYVGTGVPSFDYNGYGDVLPTNTFGSVDVDDCFSTNPDYDPAVACPTNFGSGGGITGLITTINGIKGEITSAIGAIDGGNTGGLINTIATASPGNVKNELMSKSPYLSDEVLVTYTESNPPNGHIKQVIIANSPVTVSVKDAVDALNLPNGIRNQIDAAQTGTSPRQELEKQIAYLNNTLVLAENRLIRTYLKEGNLAAAIQYLEQSATPEAICALVPIKVDKKEFTDADLHLAYLRTVADGMDATKPLKAEELREFCKFYQFVIDLQIRTSKELVPSMYEMTSSEEAYIRDIASKTEFPISVNAQNLLRLVFDEQQPRYAVEVSETANRMAGTGTTINENKVVENTDNNEVLSQKMKTDYTYKIYPNPFSNNFVIENSSIENPMIIIKDITGKIILAQALASNRETISTNMLSKGLYFIELHDDLGIIATKRVVKAN